MDQGIRKNHVHPEMPWGNKRYGRIESLSALLAFYDTATFLFHSLTSFSTAAPKADVFSCSGVIGLDAGGLGLSAF
jgi:hypothetical protein